MGDSSVLKSGPRLESRVRVHRRIGFPDTLQPREVRGQGKPGKEVGRATRRPPGSNPALVFRTPLSHSHQCNPDREQTDWGEKEALIASVP